MHKSLILSTLLLTSTTLFSKTLENEKLQILSNKLDSKDNIVIATGNVVIFSPSYYISANKVIYDKDKGTLELFDNVVILKDNTTQTQSDYAFMDLNDESITQNPVMVLEKKSNIWITSQDANKKGDEYNFNSSILSSCDCIDPAWNIRFSSADYNSKDEWLNTYNTRLYLKDVPVLYLPYLGFSTNTQRRSGLLMPTIGYSSGEGFLYSQPIYLAPKPDYDIELIPQIRTNRGYGLYSYFRYIDSEYSSLNFKTGYFEEKSDYMTKNSVDNRKHFGYSIDYIRSKLFSENESEDGLLASINWLNDLEYYNLEDNKYQISTEKKVESKINYYYSNNDYFGGLYLRHYLDMQASNNDGTLQQLPQVQLHKYSDSLFWDKLNYSADLQHTNYYRVNGLEANKTDLIVPISYSFSFIDDFLTLTLQEEISVSKIDYSNSTTSYKDATFIENRHKISLDSNLIKKYDEGIHAIRLSSDFVIPEIIKKSGDIYDGSLNTVFNNGLSEFPISETQKVLTFAINQSWTNLEDLKEIINHKIKQSVIYDDLNNSKLGNLENEIIYNYILGRISNRILYSHEDDTLIESSSGFSLNYENYFFNISHYLSKDTPNSGKEELESYALKTGFTYNKDYKFSYIENYNIEKQLKNKQGFMFEINDRCWNLNINLEKEIVPTTTNNTKQDVIYIQLMLKPLGGIKQAYKVKGD